MKRMFLIFMMLALNPPALWAAQRSFDALFIPLSPGDPGMRINPSTIVWPADFDQQIQLVNEGKAEFRCEVSTDATKWRIAKKQGTDQTSTDRQSAMFDGGEASARFQSTIALLRDHGLTNDAVRYVPIRGESCYIKVYAVMLPEPVTLTPVVLQQTGTGTNTSSLSLGLMAGLARTPILDVIPIVQGTAIYDHSFLLQVQFGHSVYTSDRTVTLIGDTETYNRTTGGRVGVRAAEPIWIVGGFFQEENLINSPSRYGDERLYRYRAAELGVMTYQKHWSAYVTITGGYEKYFQHNLDGHYDIRLGIVAGNSWGWQ